MSNFPWNPKEAWGLPENSITAVFTLLFSVSWIIFIARGIEYPDDFKYVCLGLLGLYYGRKVAQGVSDRKEEAKLDANIKQELDVLNKRTDIEKVINDTLEKTGLIRKETPTAESVEVE